jgi:apolipoprotein N-acyltransferase
MVDDLNREEGHRRSHRGYRTDEDVLTRRGGIFWGIVLLLVGILWLLSSLGYFDLNIDVVFPLLIILFGVWLIITKITR